MGEYDDITTYVQHLKTIDGNMWQWTGDCCHDGKTIVMCVLFTVVLT